MKNELSSFNLQSLTKLPLNSYSRPDSPASIIEIKTPHKGVIVFDSMEKEIKMFGGTKMVPLSIQEISQRLWNYEQEAKDYLLEVWLNKE